MILFLGGKEEKTELEATAKGEQLAAEAKAVAAKEQAEF